MVMSRRPKRRRHAGGDSGTLIAIDSRYVQISRKLWKTIVFSTIFRNFRYSFAA